jgi:lipoprotein-anchoring transpeptidase ErfK/SrfK
MDSAMMISRRQFLSSAVASSLFMSGRAFANGEPFLVNMKEPEELDYKFRRRDMAYQTNEPPGTLVVDPRQGFLYHVLGGGKATRYGVSVGHGATAWSGEATIKKMTAWPNWVPAPYHLQRDPKLAKYLPDGMPGGPDNPLGARAMYLYKGEVDTINRIHGGAKPEQIGQHATAGCIGMLNADVVHLYSQVQIGTRVVMLAKSGLFG